MKLSREEIEARLAEVRCSYITSLREKRDAIEIHWSSLRTNWEAESYQSLYLIIHSLAGSAETFGLVNISQEARHLVNQFKPIEDHLPPDDQQISSINKDISRLVASMTEAMAELDH